MSLQRTLGGKTLSADLTGKRLFPCKDESREPAASAPAHFPDSKRSDLTCVSSQVLFQLSCVHELVMTLCTFRQRFTFIIKNKIKNHFQPALSN